MEVIDLIVEELARIVGVLKSKDEAGLLQLQVNLIKEEYEIFGKRYPLIIFSEPDPNGTLIGMAEITKRQYFGSTSSFSKGFKLKNGVVTNLAEQELWEFN